jgi:predicted transposase/invertase (TIGR01784 family)
MQTPHDSLFRFVFSDPEHAKGELQHLLPRELVERIDWSTLKKLPATFVEEELSESRADIAFSVRFGASNLTLCLLLEHQSTSDHWMAFRLLSYIVRLWSDYLTGHPGAKRLPAVIPIVVHHSRSGWTSPRKLSDLYDLDPASLQILRPLLPDFEYLLDDLSGARSEELQRRMMTALGRLTLVCLSRSRQQADLLPVLEVCQGLLREAGDAPGGVAASSRALRDGAQHRHRRLEASRVTWARR